jgi:hypothetical protein
MLAGIFVAGDKNTAASLDLLENQLQGQCKPSAMELAPIAMA